MGLLYPVRDDAPEVSDAEFDDFAADLSDIWVVQVQLLDDDGAELDSASFGPLRAQEAWQLGTELDDQEGLDLDVELQPVFPYRTAGEVMDFFLSEDAELI